MLVEAVTYRFRGHSMADPEEYRSKEEVAQLARARPDPRLRRSAGARGDPRRGRTHADRRASACPGGRGCRFRGGAPVPPAGVAVRRRVRARQPGARLVLGADLPTAGRRRLAACSGPSGRTGRSAADHERPASGRGRPDGRAALPRGAERRPARGAGARRARDPDGRGHRRIRRRLQGHRRPAGGVRRAARARHADLREHDRRHGRGRRDGRPAPRGRADDDQLRAAGLRPDRQPRRPHPLHVRRAGPRAAGGANAPGRGPPAGPHALALPGGIFMHVPGLLVAGPPPRPTPRVC